MTEIEREQPIVTRIYDALDQQIIRYQQQLKNVNAQGLSGSPQNRSEREVMARYLNEQISRLSGVEERLVFGKLTPLSFNPLYIGRIGLRDHNGEQLLLDWRAQAARAFYQATPAQPQGMASRRHLQIHQRKVIHIDDEIFDFEAAKSINLQGEGALMAALNESRKSTMRDIVATIQAEQDQVIRSEAEGILIVQGGPGTGKTAVALHRAAYLLYSQAKRLEKSGVLLVGPSPRFLRYISQVLPALGETGVVSLTMATLIPGIKATAEDQIEIARIKGNSQMAKVMQDLVSSLQRVPSQNQSFKISSQVITLYPRIVKEGIQRARISELPHNQARKIFVGYVLDKLTKQFLEKYTGDLASHLDEELAADLQEANPDYPLSADSNLESSSPIDQSNSDYNWAYQEIRSDLAVRKAINLCWMPYRETDLLAKYYAMTPLRRRLSPHLSEPEVASLARAKSAPITTADIPLLDELAEYLGPFEIEVSGTDSNRELENKERLRQAQATIEESGLGMGLLNGEMLAEQSLGGINSALAERAGQDRSWVYGHVVVDEAQELSPMAWRALLRRCPSQSMTVVGDLAQQRFPEANTWKELLGPAGNAIGEETILSTCYRTPQEIITQAERVLTAAGGSIAFPSTAVRSDPESLYSQKYQQIDKQILADELQALVSVLPDDAQIAVLYAPEEESRFRDMITQILPDLTAGLAQRLVLATAADSKGLEFDGVLIANPALIQSLSPGDLFVALTRATKKVRVISELDFPSGW